jgi:hypothetical protein
MSVPLSDTARAIRTLDARYGKDGWRVVVPQWRQGSDGQPTRGAQFRVYARWWEDRCGSWGEWKYLRRGDTARDAILAAAERVRADTPARSAA